MEVMIVDDERLILMGLKSCIEKIEEVPCRVQTAMSGKQALERLELSAVDLLITDIEMQGITGLELIETASRKKYAGYFMILSGYDKFEYARKALQLKVVDYLLKPIDKDQLRANILRIDRELHKPQQLELLVPYRPYFSHLEKEDISPFLRKCMSFMQEHYTDSVSLSALSDYTGKTESYLCSLFKKEWGVTFLEIINEMRLRDSVYMLLYEPSWSVKDIAGKVGYHTERQLFRLFKGYLGMTPLQVRNQELPEKEEEDK